MFFLASQYPLISKVPIIQFRKIIHSACDNNKTNNNASVCNLTPFSFNRKKF